MKKKNPVPFRFVLDYLLPLEPLIRPMFGCHAVYDGIRILFVLRKRADHADDNGIWIATAREHHESLKKEFPSMREIRIFGEGGNWQNIPEEATDFETSALRLCELVSRKDPRIGTVPKKKKEK